MRGGDGLRNRERPQDAVALRLDVGKEELQRQKPQDVLVRLGRRETVAPQKRNGDRRDAEKTEGHVKVFPFPADPEPGLCPQKLFGNRRRLLLLKMAKGPKRRFLLKPRAFGAPFFENASEGGQTAGRRNNEPRGSSVRVFLLQQRTIGKTVLLRPRLQASQLREFPAIGVIDAPESGCHTEKTFGFGKVERLGRPPRTVVQGRVPSRPLEPLKGESALVPLTGDLPPPVALTEK